MRLLIHTKQFVCLGHKCLLMVSSHDDLYNSTSRPAFASLELLMSWCHMHGVYASIQMDTWWQLLPLESEFEDLENSHGKHWIILHYFCVQFTVGLNMQFELQGGKFLRFFISNYLQSN